MAEPATFDRFRRNVEKSRDDLLALLRRLKIEGKRVVAHHPVQRVLEPGDRSFDVGAHLGYLSLIMAKTVGPDGQVVSFEPDPRNRSHLTGNIERGVVRRIVEARRKGKGGEKGGKGKGGHGKH